MRTSPELKPYFTFELATAPLSLFAEKRLKLKSHHYEIFKPVPEMPIGVTNCEYVLMAKI